MTGGGGGGYVGGLGSNVMFNNMRAIVTDNSGNRYVTDMVNHVVRKITTTGRVSTLAGSIQGYSGTVKRVVWYFEEVGVVLRRGRCGTVKMVVWYFEEVGVVL